MTINYLPPEAYRPPRDETKIIVALGCEIRYYHEEIFEYLEAVAKPADEPIFGVWPGTELWQPRCYRYRRRNKNYIVWVIFDKDLFLKSLELKEAIVIYNGHSRYGQGPVFDPQGEIAKDNDTKDERHPICPDSKAYRAFNPWEDHVRMGKPNIGVPCIEDIWYHGTNPEEINPWAKICRRKPRSRACRRTRVRRCRTHQYRHPGGCKRRGLSPRLKRKLGQCCPKVAAMKNRYGETHLSERHYWHTVLRDADEELGGKAVYLPQELKRRCPVLEPSEDNPKVKKWVTKDFYTDFFTYVRSGSEDLDRIKLQCRVLFVDSCSSFQHFHKKLKQHKNRLKRRGIKCRTIFFLTRRVGWGDTAKIFIEMIFKGYNPTVLPPNARKGAHKIIKQFQRYDSEEYQRTGWRGTSGNVMYFR